MSVIPLILNNTNCLLKKCFNDDIDAEDFFDSMKVIPLFSQDFFLPWVEDATEKNTGSEITSDKDKYQVSIDVQKFSPEEITVKTIGQQIVVEGKHEEKQDNDGLISRHFVRKYVLPGDYKVDNVSSTISSDGVLSILAPKTVPAIENNERIVHITKS